jgi:ribosomal protein S18 acetylase RimI-like enzyme
MIKLRKMSQQEYTDYLSTAVVNYADEKIKGEGLTQEHATKLAQESYAAQLPQGLETQNQFLFSVVDNADGKVIGMVWFASKQAPKPHAFIYDISLNADNRGKGLGKQLMKLTEAEVQRLGLKSIGLHVFGHNTTAISLYEKTGFRTTNRIMVKDL